MLASLSCLPFWHSGIVLLCSAFTLKRFATLCDPRSARLLGLDLFWWELRAARQFARAVDAADPLATGASR